MKLTLKWKKNKRGFWTTYYKANFITIIGENTFMVNDQKTNNQSLKTIINFIDDGFYNQVP